MLRTCFVVALSLGMLGVSTFPAEGQDKFGSKPSKSLFSVIDEDGWPIPLSHVDKEVSKTKRNIDTVVVTERNYKLATEAESNLDLYSLRDDGVLLQRGLYVALRSLLSLEVGGKTFAYHCTYLQVGISKVAGKAYFGPLINIYYLDANADSVFETRIYAPGGDLVHLPDWVRTLKDHSQP